MSQPFSMQEVEEILDNDFFGTPEDEFYRVAFLLLYGIGRRKDTFNMARATGYPTAFVAEVRKNLIESGVWQPEDKRVYTSWEEGVIPFVLDVMIGMGKLIRLPQGITA